MKKISLLFVVFFTFFTFLVLKTDHLYAASNVITVRADTWPPYNDDPKSKLPGSMVEIVKKIFEKNGYKIDYQVMPWNRSIADVEEGKFDAIFGATTECPDCITPKEAIGLMINHFYVKKGSTWRYTGPDSLKTVSVGVIADYSYTDVFDAYVKKNKGDYKKIDMMHGDESLQKNVKKLLAGRIGAIVENPLVFNWVITKQMGLKASEFDEAGELENSKLKLYMKFSPKKDTSKAYADIFDKGIAELRKSGELQKILAKYGMTDWK
ncbi:MAG TPA: transporter substrate-binding domain-containing protein [Smithellaceae bacterium]|nr:transporter substrate-binding domain-containing protein [Smithellaceae bacterium]